MGQTVSMTAPTTDLQRVLWGLVLGYGLGAVYCFLRPLRPKYTTLSDLLFLPPAFYIWLYFSFAICRADLRFGYTLSLFLGGWLFVVTLGRLIAPVFRGFWRILLGIGRGFLCKIRKIFEKGKKCCNFLLATKKKTVRIDARQEKIHGGDHMGNLKNPFRHVRLVYRRSSKLLKTVVLVTLVVATLALLLLAGAIRQEKQAYRQMQQQAADLEQANSNLSQQIDELGTVEAVKRLAEKWLGLEDPDTVIFLPQE